MRRFTVSVRGRMTLRSDRAAPARRQLALDQHEIQRLVVLRQHQQHALRPLAEAPGDGLGERDRDRPHLEQIDDDVAVGRVLAHAADLPDLLAQVGAVHAQRRVAKVDGIAHVVAEPGEEAINLLGVLDLADVGRRELDVVGVEFVGHVSLCAGDSDVHQDGGSCIPHPCRSLKDAKCPGRSAGISEPAQARTALYNMTACSMHARGEVCRMT